MHPSPYLFLIPVINERENLPKLTTRISSAMTQVGDYHILFVDDGSTDGTLEWINEQTTSGAPLLLLSRKKITAGCLRGKALYDGLTWALKNTTCQVFIEMDGDLSHHPEDVPKGIEAIHNNADVVIASKYLTGSKIIGRPFYRNVLSWLNSTLLRAAIKPRITDYSNGFRFYTRRSADLLMAYNIQNQSPIYLGEVLCIWLQNKMKIIEVSSTYSDRVAGDTKVIYSDIWKGFKGALQIIYWYRIKGFKKRAE